MASIKNFDVLFCAYRFVDGMFGLQIELFFVSVLIACFQSSAAEEPWRGVENGFGVYVFFWGGEPKGERMIE